MDTNNPRSYYLYISLFLNPHNNKSISQSNFFYPLNIFPIYPLFYISTATTSNQDFTNSLLTGHFIQYPLLLTPKLFSILQLEIYLQCINLNCTCPSLLPKTLMIKGKINLALQGPTHCGHSHFLSLIWTITSCHLHALVTLDFFHVPLCHTSIACGSLLLRMLFPITSLSLVLSSDFSSGRSRITISLGKAALSSYHI